jgi:integrase
MPLTDVQVRKAKPRDKRYRLADGDCLSLLVLPSGVKSWRFRRVRGGVEQVQTLGQYPDMSLIAARRRRDELLDAPIAGSAVSPPLRDVARAWHTAQAPIWKPGHARDVWTDLEREIWPKLGDKPLSTITRPEILAVLQPIQDRGAVDLAHRLRQRLTDIWGFAIQGGAPVSNPLVGMERAMTKLIQRGRRPAALTLEGARQVLGRVDRIPAHPITRFAVRLLALTALRPGELRLGRWEDLTDLDGDEPIWRVPPLRMKHKLVDQLDQHEHLVPLSRQTVAHLRALHRLTGKTPLMFHSWLARGNPLTEDGLIRIHQRAGLSGVQVPHGWRATFSTIMNERYGADYSVIELMLAHKPKDQVAAAYNRAQHMARRRELAQRWADLLMIGLLEPEQLVELPRRG